MITIELAERRILPDRLIRLGIRRLLAKRLREIHATDERLAEASEAELIEELKRSPLAIETDAANEQHYEFPTLFFERVLGSRAKYSCALYSNDHDGLDQAEEQMLQTTCERAELEDGQSILELGCGWGSLTVWMAEQYPNSQITAVSNSAVQREFIERRLREANRSNVQVITQNMVDFESESRFDRIVSIEMFEHMRNYQLLLERVSGWLKPLGKLFVHVFCHRKAAYLFETEGRDNWMGRHFFSGGTMPSRQLLTRFPQEDLQVARQWDVNGEHYARTCEDWLRNLDQHDQELHQLLYRELQSQRPISKAKVGRLIQRWRMFFMACAELFHYNGGTEWFVTHLLFEKQPSEIDAASQGSAVMVG